MWRERRFVGTLGELRVGQTKGQEGTLFESRCVRGQDALERRKSICFAKTQENLPKVEIYLTVDLKRGN